MRLLLLCMDRIVKAVQSALSGDSKNPEELRRHGTNAESPGFVWRRYEICDLSVELPVSPVPYQMQVPPDKKWLIEKSSAFIGRAKSDMGYVFVMVAESFQTIDVEANSVVGVWQSFPEVVRSASQVETRITDEKWQGGSAKRTTTNFVSSGKEARGIMFAMTQEKRLWTITVGGLPPAQVSAIADRIIASSAPSGETRQSE